MLVLTRHVGQDIIIDDTIRVVVLERRGDRIRLGIEAPANVRVERSEVHARRTQEWAILKELALHHEGA